MVLMVLYSFQGLYFLFWLGFTSGGGGGGVCVYEL